MNTHLMTTIKGINNFLNTNNEPPQDLLENLVLELEVSKLYIPAIHEDDHIIFEHLESKEGIKILPLYSSKENYSGDNELTANGISYYADIILELDFEGAVIDPYDDSFFIPRDLMLNFKEKSSQLEDEVCDVYELKNISREVKNEELLKFIQNDSNFNNFTGFIDKLKDVILLNVVSSHNDLSQYAFDGVLVTLDVGGFDLSVKTSGVEKYGVLFTSLDAIKGTYDENSGLYYYYQIASLKNLFEYILMNDLDGIIINPALDDYYVPRNILLDIYCNHKDLIDNPKYRYGLHYAFII